MKYPPAMVVGPVEHYCTMFDTNFLPMGLALHESLRRHAPSAVLWVLCLDRVTADVLNRLELAGLRTIGLEELETDDLRRVRGERSTREYYWTLTPWMFDMVFEREPAAARVTYLDADMYFFRSPAPLLDAMTSEHAAIITHHAYAPEYDQSTTSGAYCVQFVTVARRPDARQAVAWWRDRCLEWCYARSEDGRFGDQRYLERWPQMLGERLLIVNRPDWAGAPWNACLADRRNEARWTPIFYHFHGFRLLTENRVLLWPTAPAYAIGPQARTLYRVYLRAIKRWHRRVRRSGLVLTGMSTPVGYEDYDDWTTIFRRIVRLLKRRLQPVPRRPIVSVR